MGTMKPAQGLRDLRVTSDGRGRMTAVRLVFGPHFYVEVVEKKGRLTFNLGATHHGWKADATELGGELERLIEAVRSAHPANADDGGLSS